MACPTSVDPYTIGSAIVPSFDPAAIAGDTNLTLGWCYVSQLISNVLGLMFYLAVTIAAIMVLYGGFVFLTAGGEKGKVETGKKVIKSALIGVAIVAGANLILRTILAAIGISDSILPWR